jgi:hypothetical protein
VSASLELLVQFVGTLGNPFVIVMALLVPFFWPRPAAVRLFPAVTAGAFALVDAAIGGAVIWGVLLVAVAAAAGAAVGQLVLLLVVPMLAVAMGAARSFVTWLRGP